MDLYDESLVRYYIICTYIVYIYHLHRRSCLQMFFKIGALKNFAIEILHRKTPALESVLRTPFFTEHLRWLLESVLITPFFTEHLRWLLLFIVHWLSWHKKWLVVICHVDCRYGKNHGKLGKTAPKRFIYFIYLVLYPLAQIYFNNFVVIFLMLSLENELSWWLYFII